MIAVLSGLLPYFAASYLVIGLINKTLTINLVLLWGILAIGGYLLKTICLTISSVCSHKMGYAVMAEIRTMLTQKLLRLSMGKATQRNAGEYKEILMDEVEHLEYPLAHMLPELTSHILGFTVVVIYMFTVSWQLALASLGTLVLGFPHLWDDDGWKRCDGNVPEIHKRQRNNGGDNGGICEWNGGHKSLWPYSIFYGEIFFCC